MMKVRGPVTLARIAAGLLLLIPFSLAAKPLQQIEDCMRANLPESVQVRTFELIARDPAGGERKMKGRLYGKLEDGLIRATMKLDAPADMNGAAYLLREAKEADREEKFIYIPSLKRVRRIAGGMKDTSLFGTDLTYADLKQISYAFTGGKLNFEREEELQSRPQWVLNLAPEPMQQSRYDKLRAWIDQQSCMMLQVDFLQADSVRKRFTGQAQNLTQSGPHWYLSEGVIEDLQKGSSTILKFTDVRAGEELAERLFSPSVFHLGR